MAAKKLTIHRVEKPWGRTKLWPGFADPGLGEAPIGEIWFQSEQDENHIPELMIKYLFTSEKLSIQVHPDDAQAQSKGYPCGKDEAWLILAADPDAVIGIGTKEVLDGEALRRAALDGSINSLLDWKPVKAGDFIYSPAGTVHAIGPGLTLVEVQQNVDLTYRVYDYGRDRELHLDAAVEVSKAEPFVVPARPDQSGLEPDRELLAEGPKFVVERRRAAQWTADCGDASAFFVPLVGTGNVDGVAWKAGDCLRVTGAITVMGDGESDVLLAYPGATRI